MTAVTFLRTLLNLKFMSLLYFITFVGQTIEWHDRLHVGVKKDAGFILTHKHILCLLLIKLMSEKDDTQR